MRPWKATLGEFFGGPSIEEHGRPVDLEDPQYSFQLYLGWPTNCPSNRDTELVSPHINESGGNQLFTDPFASLAERAVAVEYQCLALITAD